MRILNGIELFSGLDGECNIYLIDGELLIDTGTGRTFAALRQDIQSRFDPKRISTIVLTHCHYDHSGGGKKFRDWLKAPITIHPRDKEAVEIGQGTVASLFGEHAKIITVDHVLRDGDVIPTLNHEFRIIHTPGHTPGSICLYDEAKRILISGDTLFDTGVGRTDFPGGSTDDLISSLGKLATIRVDYLLPGHGAIKTSGVSFHIRQMLEQLHQSKFI